MVHQHIYARCIRLPKCAYQELLEAFRQRHYISINLIDGTKLDNGLTELIDYAITQHYPTLEYLTTGRTTFVEDMIRKYEYVIQRTIQGIKTHDFWKAGEAEDQATRQ